jgi:DNA polymerase III sliding clamp (beta) subunit (PCNA family)
MDKLFTIDQSALFNATRVIAKTIPDKAIIPAHEYIRLYDVDGALGVYAVNTENSTTVTVPEIEFEKPFDIAIDSSFLRPLKNREMKLTFSLEDNRCVITCINSRWEVPTIHPIDMPVIHHTWEPLIELEGEQLKNILETVAPFTLNELTASISNIHFKSEDGYLNIGATNRFSCGIYSLKMNNNREVSFMISKDTCDLITNIIDHGKVYVYTGSDKAMQFVSSWGTVTALGMDFENNPVNNYYKLSQRYLKRNHDIIKILDKTYFKEQIQKASVFSPINKKMLVVDILDEKLHIQVEDFMLKRKSEQEIDVVLEKRGTATKFIVSSEHLMRVITHTPSLGFDIEIPLENGENMECIKEPLVIQDQGFIFLIMPLST